MLHRLFNELHVLAELIINLKFLNKGTLHEPTVGNLKIDRKRANGENVFSPYLSVDLLKVPCLI